MVLKFLELSSELYKPSVGSQIREWCLGMISGFVHCLHLLLALQIEAFDLIQLQVEF